MRSSCPIFSTGIVAALALSALACSTSMRRPASASEDSLRAAIQPARPDNSDHEESAACLAHRVRDWKRRFVVHHFAVGTGDATLLRTPLGLTVLVDGGPKGQGRKVIAPVLKRCYEIEALDYVIVTHPHLDHYGGIQDLLEDDLLRINETLFYSGDATERGKADKSYRRFLELVDQAKIRKEVPELGKRTLVEKDRDEDGRKDETARFRFLAVAGKVEQSGLVDGLFREDGRAIDANALSVAFIVSYGSFDVFLGGDLTGGEGRSPDVETPVAARASDVDVYKSNHHGSLTSSNPALMKKLKPEQVVISVGNGGVNRGVYRLPNQAPVKAHEEQPSVVNTLLTARGESAELPSDFKGYPKVKNLNGDIVFVSDGERYEVIGREHRMSYATDGVRTPQ